MIRCPCEQRELDRAAEKRAERVAYESNLDWQFAVISESRAAQGQRPLTRSEWLAGCYEEEENGDVPQGRRLTLIPIGIAIIYLLCIGVAIQQLLS